MDNIIQVNKLNMSLYKFLYTSFLSHTQFLMPVLTIFIDIPEKNLKDIFQTN